MPAMQVITAAIEGAANQALKWSNNAPQLLAPLVDKTCIIYLQEFKQALTFQFNALGVRVSGDEDKLYTVMPNEDALDHNECWVSVSLFALDKLKQNNQMTKLIKSGKLDFSGDLSILQAVSRLFSKIDLDLEEILSKYMGDAAAYQVNTTGQKALAHAKHQIQLLTNTLADTALDEKPIGVRAIVVINFCDDVKQLRTNAERLEAKIAQLEAKRALQNETQK